MGILRDGPPPVIEWLCYLAVALVGISSALAPGFVVGDGVDMYGTLWFYWWVPDSLLSLRDPGFTELFFYPLGKDIFAHTGNNFVDAIAAAPFLYAFGVPDFQKVFVVALLLLNVASFRVFARGRGLGGWAVFAAALAWELNPYVVFEITAGRLTQAFLPFAPLALHHLLEMEESPAWRHAVLAGLFTAAQAWTYWFMGWFLAFAYLWIFVYAMARSPERRALFQRYLVAGAACLIAVAPAALAMSAAASSGEVPGLASGDINLFAPPPPLANNVAPTLHGYLLMESEGAPMLGHLSWALPCLAWLLLGRERGRWVPTLILLLLFAMGPVLPGSSTALPWYMAAYHYLPFFDRLWFPYRFLGVVMLILSLGLGQLVQRAQDLKPQRAWLAPLLIALWAPWTALEQHAYRVYPFVARDLSVPETFRWIAEEKGALIHMPFGITQPSIVWQTVHGQPLFGGMGENASLLWPEGFENRLRNSFVKALISAARDPREVRPYNTGQRERMQAEGFRWVVLHRDLVEADIYKWAYGRTLPEEERDQAGLEVTRAMVELLGPPTAVEGAIVTWDLTGQAIAPPALAPTEEALYTRSWERPPMPDYEKTLREKGRLPGGPKERK
ncbi:MAG: hypothetical protein H6741_04195 [Alphaproteobacteria bacterium]|nr:hypothetical protein [Alphaproteobacteria bacterium]